MNASVDESVTLYVVNNTKIIASLSTTASIIPVCIKNQDASDFVHRALLFEQVNDQYSWSDEQHSTSKVKSLSIAQHKQSFSS